MAAEVAFHTTATLPVEVVPIDDLQEGWTPRVAGLEREYVEELAEIASSTPPIVVHRPTMCVVDGNHRLAAARLQGRTTIAVRFLDGSEDEVMLFSIRANSSHGRRLSRVDQEAAVERVLRQRSDLSTRRISEETGIGQRLIESVRRRISEPSESDALRVGRDGKRHPATTAAADVKKERARRIVADNPKVTVRELAESAGISIGSAHNVIREGNQRAAGGVIERLPKLAQTAEKKTVAPVRIDSLRQLNEDLAVRGNDIGRTLLTMLNVVLTEGRKLQDELHREQGRSVNRAIPEYQRYRAAELAATGARVLHDLAVALRGVPTRAAGATESVA
ncbi:ParB N-terminal domain-containing protein [Amycolatopsis sp. cmx-11-12]|uniref:ParB N-terminal domain-containing protein n=1 Tax=Amycolatopsis sp. cmx-11-12 TaxID=2785795 RepID=UPI003917BBF7